MEARGAEETKHELKEGCGESQWLESLSMMWSDKNVKMENYGNLWKKIFSCICVIGIQQQKAGEGTASLQVPS